MTSELVANAMDHGLPPYQLDAEVHDGFLRVAVTDSRPGSWPNLRHPLPDEQHGRGLTLLDGLADRWGADPIPNGKSVWFVLTQR